MPDGKTLYLMRHAEAAWGDSDRHDFDRPLSDSGKCDAAKMGQRLKTCDVFPHAIISSSALRAVQTSELIATEIGFPVDLVVFRDTVYEAGVSELIEIIQSLDDGLHSAMIIGHNPSISWLNNKLTSTQTAHFPPCSIAAIHLSSNHWKDIGSCPATLLSDGFFRP